MMLASSSETTHLSPSTASVAVVPMDGVTTVTCWATSTLSACVTSLEPWASYRVS